MGTGGNLSVECLATRKIPNFRRLSCGSGNESRPAQPLALVLHRPEVLSADPVGSCWSCPRGVFHSGQRETSRRELGSEERGGSVSFMSASQTFIAASFCQALGDRGGQCPGGAYSRRKAAGSQVLDCRVQPPQGYAWVGARGAAGERGAALKSEGSRTYYPPAAHGRPAAWHVAQPLTPPAPQRRRGDQPVMG